MAGHRRGTGKPKKARARLNSWRARIAAATGPEQFYDIASDWLRAAVTHIPDQGERDQVLNSAGQHLAELADEVGRANIR